MTPQRQIRPDFAPPVSRGAPPIEGELGGTIGEWQRLLSEHFASPPTSDPVETFIATVSRWSGPVAFALALAGLIYAI